MSARIISVAHRKGGIGKTSTTIHLATALATKKNYSVLVLDTDSQQSAVKYREFEQKAHYDNQTPPYPIEFTQTKYLYNEIKHNYEKYDVIFVDVPRLTESTDDSQLTTALNYCDSVLIPIVAGELEALSTIDFVKLVQELQKNKEKNGMDYTVYGFLNKKNQRKENAEAIDYMKNLGVPMFESVLADVKALASPFTFESVMESKEGKERFEPFFNEFLEKFEL